MVAITKPTDINKIWSSGGDIIAPSDTKILSGWSAEIPPRQYFNYIDNKQDQAIAHINQYGVAQWDSVTEYQANKSYVQGATDGKIYLCVATHTNQNPETDVSDTYWKLAFAENSTTYTKAEVDAKTTIASTAQVQALANNTALVTPLRLSEAFKGGNQNVSQTGYQKLPGGIILQWIATNTSTTGYTTVNFPIPFPTSMFVATATSFDSAETPTQRTYVTLGPNTTSSIKIYTTSSTGDQVSAAVNIMVIGV